MNPQPAHEGLRIGISAWAADRSGVERVAEAALSAGIDTFWLGDGLLERPDFPPWSGGMESFGELAWLAGRYPGASVALGAAVLPLRDTQWVAKSAATLDQLTEGRFTLVLAPGNWPDEFAAMGRDFDRRGRALEPRGPRRYGWPVPGPPCFARSASASRSRHHGSVPQTSPRLPERGSTRAARSWRCGSGWESAATD